MTEWLRDYQKLEIDVLYLENKLERSKKELGRWISGDLRDVRLTADSDGAKVEDTIEILEYELAHKMNDVYDMKKLICTFNGLDNQILYKKYVEGMTLEKIAEELDYSPRYIYNKHSQIKRMIEYAKNLS